MIKNCILKIIKWLKCGSNAVDILMLLGLFIIVATTFYINYIIGLYLLGILLITIPYTLYRLTRK